MKLIYWLLGIDEPGSIAGTTAWSWHAVSPLHPGFIVLIVVLALAVAGLNLLPQNVMRWRTRLALSTIRLLGFALLLAMLCRLEAKLSVQRVVRPTVAVLMDTSESMELKDAEGQTRLESARQFAAGALAKVTDRATVIPYAFSWDLHKDDGKADAAGMTRLIDSVRETASRENDIKAIVLLTDGNDTAGNKGSLLAPLLASRKLPVFPVVFGDPKAQRISTVKVTSGGAYVRLGDELKLTATLSGGNQEEQAVTIKLMEAGRTEPLATREGVRVGKDPVDVTFVIKPEKPGDKIYRIVKEGVKDPLSAKLLVAEHRVQVLNDKIKVLYVDIPRDERKFLAIWLARGSGGRSGDADTDAQGRVVCPGRAATQECRRWSAQPGSGPVPV